VLLKHSNANFYGWLALMPFGGFKLNECALQLPKIYRSTARLLLLFQTHKSSADQQITQSHEVAYIIDKDARAPEGYKISGLLACLLSKAFIVIARGNL